MQYTASDRRRPVPLPSPAEVTVVTSPACHLCEDALEALSRRGGEVRVTVVRADTPLGRQLVQWHLPPMFPLVLVDGLFLSAGRLPRRKLEKVLAIRARALGQR